MSSSVHIDNNIIILDEWPGEAIYFINFIQPKKKDLYYVYTIMEATVCYLLMLQKYNNSNLWEKDVVCV